MIEQKDVMQMIGRWGYNPVTLEAELIRLRDKARKIKEVVGIVSYSTLLTLCRYAQTSDPVSAVHEHEMEKSILDMMEKSLVDAISDKQAFSENVLETTYGFVKDCSDLFDASLVIRENVMETVAPFVMSAHASSGAEITERILECIIGAENAQRMDYDKTHRAVVRGSDALSKFVVEIKKYSPQIEACQNTNNDTLNALTNALLGNVNEMFSSLLCENMLSIIDKPPVKWVDYSVAFGKMMSSFLLALSFGYISYEDYAIVLGNFKSAANMNAETSKVSFGRN